jgi:hypothetical protein
MVGGGFFDLPKKVILVDTLIYILLCSKSKVTYKWEAQTNVRVHKKSYFYIATTFTYIFAKFHFDTSNNKLVTVVYLHHLIYF